MWWLTLTACGWFGPDVAFLDDPPRGVPVRPVIRASGAVPLSIVEPSALELPASNRPGGAVAGGRVALEGTFERAPGGRRHTPGITVWRMPLPIQEGQLRSRAGGTHVIGNEPPPGLEVHGPAGKLPFERNAAGRGTWGFDEAYLYLGLQDGAEAPRAADHAVVYPRAAAAENALNLATSPLAPADFVRRSVTLGETSHSGLFLPAPARAAFPVQVPDRAVLTFGALVVPPALASPDASDGATVHVSVQAGGQTISLGSAEAGLAGVVEARFDLSRWAGSAVQLILQTDPGASSTFDYVLLEDPVVYTPEPHPERIILLFVDTLRPDHLGFMGYPRDTSPLLDRWAAHAAVFEGARGLAPWTLPSTMGALSGEQPERWGEIAPLAERLAAAGWRTDAFVTNAFLSQAFDVHRGFHRYTYTHLLEAEALVDRAMGALSAHADRDQLVLVHFMEPHVPYREPAHLKGLFAGPAPPDFVQPYARGRINEQYQPGVDGFEAMRDYLIARYDQNVRAVDEALPPLLRAAGPRATVVLFSDHGEAFWEHGEFEHGHDFHDELLKVVLAIRSPHLPAGRFDAPVSLLDLTPTVLQLVGVRHDVEAGQSLVPLVWGDPGSAEALLGRPLAFGRPLYGEDGWGVVTRGASKWFDRAGAQTVYDLTGDPGETRDDAARVPDLGAYPVQLQEVLQRTVRRVWRIDLRSTHPSDVTVTVSHPGGIERAWLSYDPRGRVRRPEPTLVGGRIQLVVPPLDRLADALYVLPTGDPLRPEGLAITFVGRGLTSGSRVERPITLTGGPEREVFLRVGDPRFSAAVDLAWVPEPGGVAVPGFHPELEDELKALGYLDE